MFPFLTSCEAFSVSRLRMKRYVIILLPQYICNLFFQCFSSVKTQLYHNITLYQRIIKPLTRNQSPIFNIIIFSSIKRHIILALSNIKKLNLISSKDEHHCNFYLHINVYKFLNMDLIFPAETRMILPGGSFNSLRRISCWCAGTLPRLRKDKGSLPRGNIKTKSFNEKKI